MGLDITLGVVVFLAAIRGWLKGFLYQAVRIAGAIACIFLADPVRRQARPHIAPHFTSIQPEMLDRILWWGACVVTYFGLVMVASLLLAIARRPNEDGVRAALPNDRFAGFLLGAAKGGLLAILLTAAVEKYALSQLKAIPWAEQQVNGSKALAWNQAYEPVPLIWKSQPVQHLVEQVQKMGIPNPPKGAPATPPAGQIADRSTEKKESRNPRLAVSPNNSAPATAAEIDAALDDIKARIDRKDDGNGGK